MAGPRVKCVVDTCTHWVPGSLCGAANIDILHEEEGRMARRPEQTECKTFSRKRGLANYLGSVDNVGWGGFAREAFQSGQQITPSVTCVVDACAYWESGDRCNADAIEVGGQGADECQDTNCATSRFTQAR